MFLMKTVTRDTKTMGTGLFCTQMTTLRMHARSKFRVSLTARMRPNTGLQMRTNPNWTHSISGPDLGPSSLPCCGLIGWDGEDFNTKQVQFINIVNEYTSMIIVINMSSNRALYLCRFVFYLLRNLVKSQTRTWPQARFSLIPGLQSH